VGSAKEYLG